MKSRLSSLFLVLFASVSLFACIDEDSTYQSILLRDIEAIDAYIAENPIDAVQEFHDDDAGFHIFWESVSNSGDTAQYLDTLKTDYIGMLLTNKVFDTSIDSVAIANDIYNSNRNYVPIQFLQGNNSLIYGFQLGVSMMAEGDVATVIMPSAFAYGTGGSNDGSVPSNSPIIFKIDFVELKKATQ
ncbi:FKBP-type peptidyl-prolyl cis-trans isomerase [Algoriphagus sp. PAP.12]|uniref:FKBP-type peptidyl-prolyl cis-trans isomerase n=1 Tax=Algoriphagus sp. PAP.12 TaxID=2996678 RepID=UPI00227AE1EF|nr:FKBP-type peptidyl-prolyl cis-trans isomerase [Algoriphagus sp. PAP.12]